MRRLILSTFLSMIALPVLAEDAAVLIGVERYRSLDRFVGGTDVADAARELTDAGYRVEAIKDKTATEMRQLLTRLQTRSADAERLVVALSGRFVTDGTRSWLLSATAPAPTLFGLEQEGLSVESVLKVMSSVPGKSILLLAYEKNDKDAYDPLIREGIGKLDIPQGVTVVMGDPRNVTRLIEDTIVSPNAEVVEAVASNRNIFLFGYRPQSLIMQSTAVQQPANENTPGPYIVDRVAETLTWQQAVREDTLASYRAYLSAFPRGNFASQATAAIRSIQSEPNRAARLNEERLNLTRDQRRGVQRDLSILSYNTRGIDGIFGPGTRTAISNWQQQNGFSQTGFLTDEQVTRINAQATRRSAQLEAEAAREREAQLRHDRAFWEETGANGREPGLRSYLDRYPDGIYSEQASQVLAQIGQTKLVRAARVDRDAWTIARNTDTVDSYTSYLKSQGRGAFREEAEARISALRRQQQNVPTSEQARAQEASLGLNAITRRLIEGRLATLGLDPGSTDGRFDDKTRRAIRQFQRSRNQEPTGFLSQASLVQLLVRAGN